MAVSSPLMTRSEAAQYVRRSVQSMRRWARGDVGPPFLKTPGQQGRCFYRVADLDAWISGGCRLDRRGSRPAGLERFEPPAHGVRRGPAGRFVGAQA